MPQTLLPQCPAALPQPGVALHVCGVSLRYARTPQAQGKIERQHQYWQGRLPALFADEASITPESANGLLPDLRRHERLRAGARAGTRVSHCRQPNGTISILAHAPKAGERLALLL